MALPNPRLELVEEDEPATPQTSSDSSQALAVILEKLLGLRAMAQRAAIALSDCFSLATVGTVFWLCLAIVPYEPTVFQLAGLGGYALFVVAVNIIVRRR